MTADSPHTSAPHPTAAPAAATTSFFVSARPAMVGVMVGVAVFLVGALALGSEKGTMAAVVQFSLAAGMLSSGALSTKAARRGNPQPAAVLWLNAALSTVLVYLAAGWAVFHLL
ncbi:hypothetical protein C1Y63_05495 [Corynebacterium sp. 13CS0277]|uniref:hypothetical protein n=1 Tax=Corynebacterium sp. 13CS0277 TaxID=2071994 RepID=UPI000D038BFE|nr:hypothetical protein [Corynebacterium sp. 13CS0277]PRQ11631.1 hypothetical protein C1Y63_05495 [Corynebacterium sp. 13CS0277]